jgi:hypothetical protein
MLALSSKIVSSPVEPLLKILLELILVYSENKLRYIIIIIIIIITSSSSSIYYLVAL